MLSVIVVCFIDSTQLLERPGHGLGCVPMWEHFAYRALFGTISIHYKSFSVVLYVCIAWEISNCCEICMGIELNLFVEEMPVLTIFF